MASRDGRRTPPAAVRRRRAGLICVAVVALGAGAIVGGQTRDDPSEVVETEPEPPVCPAAIGTSDRRLTGRMLVARLDGEPSPELLARVRRGELGGVILFPRPGIPAEEVGRWTASLHRAAQANGVPDPVVMIDQEGGEVKRLVDLPPVRGPEELAALPPAAASAEGEVTGTALSRLGIGIDLAPVLDVPGSSSFIASRALGIDADSVAARGVAFARGLAAGGVAATAKHFPGLGLATISTDEAPSAIPASRRELEAGMWPFEASIDAGVPLVMTSNAVYPELHAAAPASLSRAITTRLLRGRLGFEGVVITDDLGAGALVAAGYGEAEAAVAGARAGADLLLFALSDAADAHAALLEALRRGALEREALLASCARVVGLAEDIAAGAIGPVATD